MIERLKTNPIAIFVGIAVAVMVGLTALKEFADGTAPWLVDRLAPVIQALDNPGIWVGLLAGMVGALAVQNVRREVVRRQGDDFLQGVLRDYYADVSALRNELDPAGHSAANAGAGSGEADAQFVIDVLSRHSDRQGGGMVDSEVWREAKARVEAARQGLTLHELPNGRWEIGSQEGTDTLLGGNRIRLADGRETGQQLSLQQLEAFLAAGSRTGDRQGSPSVSSLRAIATATGFIENDDDPDWVHAVNAAVLAQRGSLDPTDQASRARLVRAIQARGYPEAEMDYDPPDGVSLPRITLRPRVRTASPPPMSGAEER